MDYSKAAYRRGRGVTRRLTGRPGTRPLPYPSDSCNTRLQNLDDFAFLGRDDRQALDHRKQSENNGSNENLCLREREDYEQF